MGLRGWFVLRRRGRVQGKVLQHAVAVVFVCLRWRPRWREIRRRHLGRPIVGQVGPCHPNAGRAMGGVGRGKRRIGGRQGLRHGEGEGGDRLGMGSLGRVGHGYLGEWLGSGRFGSGRLREGRNW